MDPGPYDLTWLLEPDENIESVSQCQYLSQEDIDKAVKGKHNVDQLYLVKWRGLSYTQNSWEPESIIRPIFDEKIFDFNRFNRSLD